MSDGHGTAFVPERYVLAEFADTDTLLAATTKLREAGVPGLDSHSPYPIHGMEDALGLGRPIIPKIVLAGALIGACVGYGMMYFMNVVDFPINIGNRPPHSPPAFVPITFELTVLLGGCSAFLGSLGLFKLPRPYHPLFESERFKRASVDGFFLSAQIPTGGDAQKVADQAKAAGATSVEILEESER